MLLLYWQGLCRWFPQELAAAGLDVAGWKIVLPVAPQRRISCYDGILQRAWHDYLTDPADDQPQIDEQHVHEQRSRLHQLLSAEAQVLGGSSDRLFVAGYSQGGCVALDAALTFTSVLGGMVL